MSVTLVSLACRLKILTAELRTCVTLIWVCTFMQHAAELGQCVALVNMSEHAVVSSAQIFEHTASSGTFEREDRIYSIVWCSIV